MDVKGQTTPPGHKSHGVHFCNRCGWPFPNPHPSAKHRRAHKKICGTIDGYTNSIRSEVGSDDSKEKTPSPKIEEKMSIRGSFSRSEDELFSDAATEFSDGGTSTVSANKTLDRDLFFSFKDAENDGTNELLNAPIEIGKVDTGVEISENIDAQSTGTNELLNASIEIGKVDTGVAVSENIDAHVEKFGDIEITTVFYSSESNLELTKMGLIKDGVMGPKPESSQLSHSQETKTVDVVDVREEKDQESQTFKTTAKEAKDSDLTKTFPDVSAIVGGDHGNVKQGNFGRMELSIADGIGEGINQNFKFDHEHVSEVVNKDETVVETHIEKFKLDDETASEVVKESETDHLEIEHEKFESNHKHAPVVAKEAATVQNNTVLIEKEDFGASNVQIQDLTEKKDLETHEFEKGSIKQFQEVVKEPNTVLAGKEDLCGSLLDEKPHKHNNEVAEKPDSVLTKGQDLGAPELAKCSKEHVEEPNLILAQKEDLSALKSEKYSKDEVIQQKVGNDCYFVADASIETNAQFSSDNSVVNGKNASDVGHVATVEEGRMNNQDSGTALSVNSSTRSSLEGNWGSVSVLSTASFEATTLQSTEKLKVNSGKLKDSNVLEPQSLMQPERKDKKPESSEVKDSQKQTTCEAGRKRNEEVIAKVRNWSTGKQSTPLKNLLGGQPEPMVQKDDDAILNTWVTSPPKLIDDDAKRGTKKLKSLSSWFPFVCCSSVNVVN
ncbi:hypothetical protein E3N88_24318 [Mikania micrantha]|uniref:C2H2-type domain-containing protein n=1 Tax=Mikania micrantha TaxID=192012 RepID=A0A5N6N387_9ASTR|nr:hypothetical protein E3N88_24318 [Mikania micrantha]